MNPNSILGQSRALDLIGHALRSGRFHHAWIFSGPRGVGKFTTAMQLARILLDPEARNDFEPDLSIPGAKSHIQNLIDSGTHPDLHVIRKELVLYSDNRELRERKQMNIPIDLLRERVVGGKSGDTYYDAPAYRTAARGHGKVFIIDEAELLALEGQNSMLKTLEEPPVDTFFFLITNLPERLLSTIRSRCQHVRFGRLDDRSMRQWFDRQRPADSRGASDSSDGVDWVERFAEGSPGLAQLSLEYGFFDWRKTLDPMLNDLERGKFPVQMGEQAAALVDQFAMQWVKAHKNASKDAANKDGARHLFSLLGSHVRTRLSQTVADDGDPSSWLAVLNVIRDAERELESNVNLKLLLENLVVQWSQAQAKAPVLAQHNQS